ncbi:LLM class flavin-dependent oxidoreductase [Micromonospora sp. NBC_01392]|uniref:hypothetical protein n=1 Tax=Micromonospora sp. NBC_01392 TaxID=2903588 RepID=UPI00324EDBD9
MRHGLEISCGGASVTVGDLVVLGELAERSGWDGVFLDPWLVLAAVAGRTERVRLAAMRAAVARGPLR